MCVHIYVLYIRHLDGFNDIIVNMYEHARKKFNNSLWSVAEPFIRRSAIMYYLSNFVKICFS